MKTITKLQKEILLKWATICINKRTVDIYLDLVWYNDDKHAFIEFDGEIIDIPYNLKEDWLGMFTRLTDDGYIRLIRPDAFANIRRAFLYGFVSHDFLEKLISVLKQQ